MKYLTPLLALCVFAFFFYSGKETPHSWISFDTSMSKAASSFVNCYSNKEGQRWKWLKNLYEKGMAKKGNGQIPNTIHQI